MKPYEGEEGDVLTIAEHAEQLPDAVEIVRFEHSQPHIECFACQSFPPMAEPRFCTNCGSWFDGALMVLHCTEWQEPPAWDEIQRASEHHLWSAMSKVSRAIYRGGRRDDHGDWAVERPCVEQSVKDREGWVYRLWDAAGDLLYIGMTGRKPAKRLDEHRRTKKWWQQVARIDAVPCRSRNEAAAEEVRQIRALRPKHNIVHNRRKAAVKGEPVIPSAGELPAVTEMPGAA